MPYNTEAKWRREEDDYFRQIGLLDRLMKDPVAAYGAERMRSPPGGPINVGGQPYAGPTGVSNYGDYSFRHTVDDPGELNIGVGLPQDRYAGVMAHELGHVGSRWLNEGLYPSDADEEMRQRVADLEMGHEGAPMTRDASRAIDNRFGGLAAPKVRDAFKKNIMMAKEAKERLKRLKEAKRLQKMTGMKTDKEN